MSRTNVNQVSRHCYPDGDNNKPKLDNDYYNYKEVVATQRKPKPVPLPRKYPPKNKPTVDKVSGKPHHSPDSISNLYLPTGGVNKEDGQFQTNRKDGRDNFASSSETVISDNIFSSKNKQDDSCVYDNVETKDNLIYPKIKSDESEAKCVVKELCALSAQNSLGINNLLNNPTNSDMKKFYSSKRERVVQDSVDVGPCKNIPGTYRKITETSECDELTTGISSVLNIARHNQQSDKICFNSDRPSSLLNTESFEFDVSQITVRPTNPPLEKPKRKKEQPDYENWTINAFVTQSPDSPSDEDDEEGDDDDDDEEDDYANIEVIRDSILKIDKNPHHEGSQDSGLCDVLSSANVDEPGYLCMKYGDEDDNEGLESDKTSISTDSTESDNSGTKSSSSDNLSIASEIVFISGTDYKQLTQGNFDNSLPEYNVSERKLSPAMKRIASFAESPICSSGEDTDSLDECDALNTALQSDRDKLLTMRQLILKGICDSEKDYLVHLQILLKYKGLLEAAAESSQPVITKEEINTIFSNISNLCATQKEFVTQLSAQIQKSVENQIIGDVFMLSTLKFLEIDEYMANYQNAVATVHRCCQGNQTFQDIAQVITIVPNSKETCSLEDALFKPVNRVQRNSLVLHDIQKYTPEDHPDYCMLEKALTLTQHNLENFCLNNLPGNVEKKEEKRNLVKISFIVELIQGSRKLRCIFLFNDIIICTKRETHRGKISFDVKWFIPLVDLGYDTKFEYQDDQKFSNRDDIDDLKQKIGKLKSDLRDELKKEADANKHWYISGMAAARSVEKLKKKIQELEGQMIIASPKLPFKLSEEDGRPKTFLMSTDYEREEWRETILSLYKKSSKTEKATFSALQAQEIVNSVKELPQVNRIGSVIMQKDEEVLDGTLNVTIHKLNGLHSPADTYCCLEMDSFGHFFMKARTHISTWTADPSWNEDFELELDGSHTLRILCYEKGPAKSGDTLLGRGAFELGKDWLKSHFQEKNVSMNEVSLVISVKHTPADKTMRRTPSRHKLATFGVKISACTKREGKTVPALVTACIAEVEKRGLDEVGIYRVSGVTSEVQKLKKIFDKNIRAGVNSVGESDIHAVTGLLKLYFRELPEPIFTENKYSVFKESIRLSDEEARVKCMLNLLHSLPDANYYTIVALIEHLVKVSKLENQNKMSLHNLATIFGPTLLAPAVKENTMNPLEMMSQGAVEVMHQSQIIGFYFNLLVSQGKSLRRSAQC